ncbi:XRE family transcriptional regulator [Pasteurella bettyae]|uniref:Bacteriophage CI repressor protein n=1 Tax=Pasteurella bettyae CCUG 2042 TaxID=1095749 RepID=I3DKB7_9PAST|nr:helix-turn-helix transcriptional regulator [Pasteurella bettyae]EIJ72160.1 bacteriophage CI repressor protein [Pasteurella bettyae CCUG 2042]SUB20780.1 putative bacteriophage transcriptional regulator [Pasteurella bettyae]
MNTLAERLKFLLNEKGLTQEEFANLIGITQPSVFKILNGQTKNPTKIYEIATALGVNIDWLKTGKGEPNLSQEVSAMTSEPDNDHAHRIDVLDVDAAASTDGILNVDYPEIIQSIWFSDVGVGQILGRKSTQGVHIIRVPTDSMMPTISPRDLVFIDTNINQFISDGVYVFKLNGHTFIKRLQRLPDGSLRASSDNKQYEPFAISAELFDTAEIIGKFVSVVSFNPRDL